MWKQHSRVLQLKEGDKNSKFFHAWATNHKRQNRLNTLCDDLGNWLRDYQLNSLIVNYFKSCFPQNQREPAYFLSPLAGRITGDMHKDLSRDFGLGEILIALNQMHPNKALGLDGMSPIFYQKYWSTVGPIVTEATLQALQPYQFPTNLNHTHITLIPKKKQPLTVVDYHSISLCNVLYKLFSKVLANKIKHLLSALISDSQCTFVPEKIIDDILVAYEIVHFLKR